MLGLAFVFALRQLDITKTRVLRNCKGGNPKSQALNCVNSQNREGTEGIHYIYIYICVCVGFI